MQDATAVAAQREAAAKAGVQAAADKAKADGSALSEPRQTGLLSGALGGAVVSLRVRSGSRNRTEPGSTFLRADYGRPRPHFAIMIRQIQIQSYFAAVLRSRQAIKQRLRRARRGHTNPLRHRQTRIRNFGTPRECLMTVAVVENRRNVAHCL